MWQRFTERARKVVFYAQEEAQKYGEGYVSTEHLLLGIVRNSDSTAASMLEKLGISLSRVRSELEKQLPSGSAGPSPDMTLTPRAKRVIDLAYEEARNLNHNYIGTEHLLLGLIREGDGLAGRVLEKFGADLESTRRTALEFDNEKQPFRAEESPTSAGALASMTEMARNAASANEDANRKLGALADAAQFMMLHQGRFVLDHLFLCLLATQDFDIGSVLTELHLDRLAIMSSIEFRMLAMASEASESVEPTIADVFEKAHLQALREGTSVKPIQLAIAILELSNGISAIKVELESFRTAWENLRDK